MNRYRYAASAGAGATACLAAGPVFVTTAGLFAYLDAAMRGPIAVSMEASVLPLAAIMIAPLVVVVGLALAVIPVTIGSVLLARLAWYEDALAAPEIWVMTGAAMAAGVGWLVTRPEVPATPIAALAVTGAVCAAICRRGLTRGDGL